MPVCHHPYAVSDYNLLWCCRSSRYCTMITVQTFCYWIVCTSDVTKLVRLYFPRMWILTFRIRRMRMRIEEFISSVGM